MQFDITPNTSVQSARSRYEGLAGEREPYKVRAERSAEVTIPMAFPREYDGSSYDFPTPYQSIGARGVNNLASKLQLALVPPNEPFFRLGLGDELKRELIDSPNAIQQYEEFLQVIEKIVLGYMENNQVRAVSYEMIIQLVIAGNALLFLPPKEGGMRLYRLNSYVVQRDGVGNVLQIIAKDTVVAMTLPEEAQSLLGEGTKPDTKVEVYTHIFRDGDRFLSYQEVNGKEVPGSDQNYPIDACPWIPLRLRKMDGESYGRSFVDEYIGDLKVLESLSKSLTEVAAIAGNILFLVPPNSQTRVQDLQKAKSGEFVVGRAEDVQVLQINKASDLQIAVTQVSNIEQRLSYNFLLNSAVQRNAERVTAEEIRYVAKELQDTIGAVYSILGQEFQLPLVRVVMAQMKSKGLIPDMPQGAKGVEPVIVTGVEALGRGHDLTKLDTFIRYAQIFPEAFQNAVKQNGVLSQIATSIGIDPKTLIKSDEEIAQEQEQAMAQAATMQMGQQAIQQEGAM